MNLWVLELFDLWFNCPVTIGVYTSSEKAEAASEIIFRQLMEKNLEDPTKRYNVAIVPIQSDSFIDTAMAWISD